MSKIWTCTQYGIKLKIYLSDKEVIFTDGENIPKTPQGRLGFIKFLTKRYLMYDAKTDFEVCKEVASMVEISNLSSEEKKRVEFWQAFNNESLEEQRIETRDGLFLYIDSYCVARGNFLVGDKYSIFSHQSFADFFFNGSELPDIQLQHRVQLRRTLFNCLTDKNHSLSLEDAFILFDYNKIEPVDLHFEEGIRGSYLRINGGTVTIGGWDNPRDGGEYNTSPENLWYNCNTIIPNELRSETDKILANLKNAQIPEPPENAFQKLNPHSQTKKDTPPNAG